MACLQALPQNRPRKQGIQEFHSAASENSQADAGTRTPDPIITSDVLYQLSYVGAPVSLPLFRPGSVTITG
jgi:hypothetical protein